MASNKEGTIYIRPINVDDAQNPGVVRTHARSNANEDFRGIKEQLDRVRKVMGLPESDLEKLEIKQASDYYNLQSVKYEAGSVSGPTLTVPFTQTAITIPFLSKEKVFGVIDGNRQNLAKLTEFLKHTAEVGEKEQQAIINDNKLKGPEDLRPDDRKYIGNLMRKDFEGQVTAAFSERSDPKFVSSANEGELGKLSPNTPSIKSRIKSALGLKD